MYFYDSKISKNIFFSAVTISNFRMVIASVFLQTNEFDIHRELYMNVERREDRFDPQGYLRTTPKMVRFKVYAIDYRKLFYYYCNIIILIVVRV